MRFRSKLVMGCALGLCALVVAACGSSSSSNTASHAAGGATKSSVAAIKLMVMGPTQAPQFADPELPVGAQVAADQINARGGVNGHKLQIVVCDDQNDPNQAAKCARQAISDGVAAMVGGFTQFEANVLPILQSAGIPWVAPTPVANFNSKIYFIIGSDPATEYFGVAEAMSRHGCTKAAALAENFPAAHQAEQLFHLGAAAAKLSYAAPVYEAQNAPDWAPALATATNEGAPCIGIVSNPNTAARIILEARKTGKSLTIGSVGQILPMAVIKSLGAAGNGVVSASSFLPFSSNNPEIVALKKAALAINPKIQLNDFVSQGYAGVEVIAQAAKGLSSVTPQSLMQALPKVTNVNTGIGATVSLNRPNPAAAFSRVFNTEVYPLVAKDGEYTLAAAKPINVLPAYQAAAAALAKK